MFVATNALKDVVAYFENNLSDTFTQREIKTIAKAFICERFNWSDSDYLIQRSQATCSESDLLYFRNAVKRIKSGEPFQYVLGKTWFYDVLLKIDRRALIPRPETEELVDWILKNNTLTAPKIVDIGTGSGCIPIALKKHLPQAIVTGLDVCDAALDLAIENAKFQDVDVAFFKYDVLQPNDSVEGQVFDIVVSNPPYIPIEEKHTMAKHVVDYEPEKALFVPQDKPLLFYEHIIDFTTTHLASEGLLYLEIHEELADGVVDVLEKASFKAICCKKDLQGKNRMIKAVK